MESVYSMLEYLWLVPLGAVAGILGSMAGLGGGIVIVPVLTFLGFPPTLVISNSLFAAFSNAVASSISYSKQKRIDYSVGFKLGLFSVPGTVLGALISTDVTPDIFKILFALVLVTSGIYIFLRKNMYAQEKTITRAVFILVIGTSFFAGVISSFFGIGGGTVFVPLMVIAMGMSMKKAAPTSQFVLLFAAFSGLIVHSILGHPDFIQSLYLAVGAFGGGLAGARLSLEIKERYLQILISVILFIVAIKMAYDSFV